jgi:hypothetical protein
MRALLRGCSEEQRGREERLYTEVTGLRTEVTGLRTEVTGLRTDNVQLHTVVACLNRQLDERDAEQPKRQCSCDPLQSSAERGSMFTSKASLP